MFGLQRVQEQVNSFLRHFQTSGLAPNVNCRPSCALAGMLSISIDLNGEAGRLIAVPSEAHRVS